MLSSTICIDLPRALGVGARGFGRLLGGGERVLALLQLGDVAVDADDGAVVERLVAHLDVMAAGGGPLEAHAARRAHVLDLLADLGLDVVDRAEIAALDLEAPDVAHQAAGIHHVGRIVLELHHPLVDEMHADVVALRRHQRDAVVHVVDHGGEDVARAFDFAPALLHLLEQPHGLDRDHRLIGEGGNQLDLSGAERAAHRSRQRDDADRLAVAQQRHAEDGAEVRRPGGPRASCIRCRR